ncbi:MAG TPA: hypothetical protein VFS43_09250 [Polyangiaceae bacterium]|nr:hypothetical protein [Polyangiaceae bacterium]
MRTRAWLAAALAAAAPALLPPAASPAAAQSAPDAAQAARADLDALYKGDYRRAFVEKNADLFGRHIAPDLRYSSYDGSTADAEGLKAFVAGRIATIERVVEHSVSLEHVTVDEAGRITAVVTLTTVLDLRSPAGTIYTETGVSTYRDAFVKQADGSLLEVSAELLRSHTARAPRP